jgi:hypothetical protein
MEGSVRNFNAMLGAKTPSELLKGQLDVAREFSERALNEGRETIKAAGDSREEYRAWMESGMQTIAERMKTRPTA